MKKTLLVVLTIAVLGFLIYTNKQVTPHLVAGPHTTSPPATSSSNTTAGSASSATSAPNTSSSSQNSLYKDGTYTGDAINTPYGTVQISAIIGSGKITDINFMQMPGDFGHSVMLTSYAEPLLKQTTLQNQNATNIDFVSGATSTSYGYQQSLQSALDQAATGSTSTSTSG